MKERKEEGSRRKGERGRGRESSRGEYLEIRVKIHRFREV